MSRIESGADGITFITLVKTYWRGQTRKILEDFRDLRLEVRHLRPIGRLGRFVPGSRAEQAGKYIG